MSDNDVNVKFGADVGGAEAAITELRETMEGFAAPISGLMSALGELKETLVAAFAIEQISEFIEQMAQLGTATERSMAILGVSSKEVAQLSLIAQASGGTLQGMTSSLERLQVNLQKAGDATTPVGQALKAIGLSASDLVGIPIPQQMDKIADGLAKFADGGNKTAIAIALLGRGGANMIPILDQGSAGLNTLRDAAVNSGSVLSEDTVKGLTMVHVSALTLTGSITGLGAAIVGSFGQSIRNANAAMTDMVSGLSAVIQAGGLQKAMVAELKFTWDFFVAGMVQNAVVIKDVLTLNWGSIVSDWKAGTDKMQDIATEHWNAMLRDAGIAKLKLAMAVTPEGAEKSQAPAISTGGGDGAAAAQKELDGEIKVLQQGLAQKKLILDQEVAQHQISNAQKFQSLQDYTDDEYEDEKDLLVKELALYAQGTSQYAGVKSKLLELDQKYANESTKIQGDAVKAQQATYQSMFNAVEGAFNSQLKGLLAGTTSWSQAFKSILGSLIISFIEAVEKMGFEWLAGELAKTTATVAGVTARTGAEATGAAASSGIAMVSVVRSIMSSAAQTFAGIFAFLSPTLGPAAAAPATAAEAVVASTAVAAYEQGTPWVPSDGMAMLHRGEAVLPASVNAAGLNGASGGGGGQINITALDARSVLNLFKDNAGAINKLLGNKMALTA
jgi:hypothetical protein